MTNTLRFITNFLILLLILLTALGNSLSTVAETKIKLPANPLYINKFLNQQLPSAPKTSEQIDSSGSASCVNPIGWIEDLNSKLENVNVYFVPKSTQLKSGSNPQTNPGSYSKVVCSFAQKVNYKDKNTGKFKKVDTRIRRINSTDTSAVTKNYVYVTGDNDFKAYFPADPNEGWKFINSNANSEIKIKKVSVADKNLNKQPVVEVAESSITYQEILPGVDLKYVVDANGVNKYFVIKNALGLQNNLSKITFNLETDKNLIQDVAKIKTNISTPILSSDAILAEASGTVLFEKPYTFDSKTLEARLENYQLSRDGKEINIFPDLSYLQSPERQFPIMIDPKVVSAGTPASDSFVRDNSPSAPQGSANRHMLSVGGKFYDPTTSTWLGKTRTFMNFTLPAEVNDPNNIIGANFRLRQYATYNGGFRAKVYGVYGAFDEWKMTWNNQNSMAAEYGYVDFEKVNLNGNGNGKDIWSSDIVNLARESVGSGRVLIGIRDEDESKTRGVAFCAKDGNISGHPCNSGDKGPVLQIYLNNRPTPPNAESPTNRDENNGYCDLSQNTGNCGRFGRVDYRVSNINDGDNDCNNSNVLLVQKDATYWYAPWYNQTGFIKACGTQTIAQDIPNGRYSWAAINRDNYGLESNRSNIQEYFTVDTQPPFKTQPLEVPAYSKDNKVSFQSPEYLDNLLQKFRLLHVDSKGLKSIDIDGRNYGGAYSNIQLYDTYSSANQEFSYDTATREIRSLFGKCLDAASNDNGAKVYIYDCHGGNNQKWELTSAGKIVGVGSGKCLSLVNSTNNGTPITIWDCVESTNQNWQVQKIERIRLKVQNQNLSLSPACTTTNCLIYGDYSNNNQEKQGFVYTKEQEFKTLINYCFDGRYSQAGDTVYLYYCHGGDNQKWIIDVQNNQIKIKSNQNLCLSLSDGLSANVVLKLQICNSQDAKQKLLPEAFVLFNQPNHQLSYLVQVSKNPEFTDLVNANQTWTTVPQFDIGGLAVGSEPEKTFYIRMKSRDRNNGGNVSAWSETKTTIQDVILPIIKNINTKNTRFSSNGLQSLQTTFDFEYEEKNFASAQARVYDSNGQTIRILNEDVSLDKNKLQFSWDGKNDKGEITKSDGYYIQLIVTDKAGNTNDQNLINSKILLNVDNSAPKINISSPINNLWTNQDTFDIKGAVGVSLSSPQFAENDVESLEIAKIDLDGVENNSSTGFDYQKVNFDKNLGNTFSTTQNLDLGNNQFKFKAIDDLGNTNTQVGLPPSQEIWNINYENTAPKILEISPQGNLQNGAANQNPILSFKLQDLQGTAKNQVSGLDLNYNAKTINPKGFDISLIRSLDGGQNWSEIALYKDGLNLTDKNSVPRLAGDLVCVSDSLSLDSIIDCDLPLNNLQPDGLYKIYIRVSDKAGNKTCNYKYSGINSDLSCQDQNYGDKTAEFRVKTTTYLNLDQPLDSQNIAQNTLLFSGKIEKGSTLKISNDLLDRRIEVDVDNSKIVLPKEFKTSDSQLIADSDYLLNRELSLALQPINIECKGELLDHDNNPATVSLELCSFSILLNQKDNYSLTNTTPGINVRINNNQISAEDAFGNKISKTKVAMVDLYGINLSSTASVNMFSPNGDGRFDQVEFKNKATKIVSGEDYSEDLLSYSAKIIDSNGNLVWQKNSPVPNPDSLNALGNLSYNVPSNIIFDGKSNVGLGSGQWLANGNYSYTLSITTKANTTFTTLPQTLSAKSDLTSEAIILTPQNNFTTTRGLINVQGQAPKNWTANICVVYLVSTNGQNCDYTQSAVVNDYGFFSSIIALPYGAKTYKISVIASDQFGNQTPTSNTINVNFDSTGPIKSASLSSDLSGLNTPEMMKKFAEGSLNINDLKTLKFQAVVTQYTESIDLDFADYTNLSELPNTDPNTGLAISDMSQKSHKISTINQSPETSLAKNPEINTSIKKDMSQYLSSGQSGRDLVGENKKVCDKAECDWIYKYPYPTNLSGGIYEVRIRGYKGETIQEFTQSFIVNGVTPSSPVILTADKPTEKFNCTKSEVEKCEDYKTINKVQNSFYTNNSRVRLHGASDPGVTVNLNLKNSEGVLIKNYESILADQNGFWNLELDLPDVESIYTVELNTQKNQVKSETVSYNFVLDKTISKLKWVQTQTASSYNSFAVNPWVNSSLVNFKFQADEPILQADLFDPTGDTVYKATKEIPSACVNNLNQKPTTDDIDQWSTNVSAECRKQYSLLSQINSSIVPQNETQEGIYTPIIHLEDLAGNRVFYSNTKENLDNLPGVLKALNNNHPYQADPRVQVTILDNDGKYLPEIQNGDALLGTQSLPANYPYSQESRGKSLDFRLFFDITATAKTDFDLPSPAKPGDFGDKVDGILADGKAAEADRIMTDPSWFTKANGCQQNSPSECTPKASYTVRGDKIYLKGLVEKNQRIVLTGQQKKSTDSSINKPFILTPVVNLQNCAPDTQVNKDKIKNNLVVRFRDLCSFEAVFDLKNQDGSLRDDGLSLNGVPTNYYTFSFYAVDLAGNVAIPSTVDAKTKSKSLVAVSESADLVESSLETSIINANDINYTRATITTTATKSGLENIGSSTITVYHDTDAPKNTAIINTNSKSYNPLIDFNRTDIGSPTTAITKDTSISVTLKGEQQADLDLRVNKNVNTALGFATGATTVQEFSKEIEILDDLNNLISTKETRLLRNGKANDPTASTSVTLGASRQDDSDDTCTTISDSPMKNRRLGVCNDGLYTIRARAIDTAGNRSGFVETKVERDTVSPQKPELTISKVPDPKGAILGEYLGVNITAEAGSKAFINVQDEYGNEFIINKTIGLNGKYEDTNLLGYKLYCGNITYKIKVRVMDKAENVSVFSSTKSITTEDCPSCSSTGNSELKMPVRAATAYVSSEFGVYEPARRGPHAGMDIAANANVSVYSAKAGKVIKVVMGYDSKESNGAGWGNLVIVEHYDDAGEAYLQTIYAHLRDEKLVSEGDLVDTNKVIGKVGSSGNSTGPHLHFQVERKGVEVRKEFIGRYNRWGPVNPRDYLGDITGNLTEEQKDAFCANTEIGDSDGEEIPDISEETARYAIAEYINLNLKSATQIEYNTDGRQLYETKIDLLKRVNFDWNLVRASLTPVKICENIWLQHLGRIDDDFNLEDSFNSDGAIVVNNYVKEAFVVKGDIFNKWVNNNVCRSAGVPTSTLVFVNEKESYSQYFMLGMYRNNFIFRHWKGDTRFVVGKVAQYFDSIKDRFYIFGIPEADTENEGSQKYCKQRFEIAVLNVCTDLTKTFQVSGQRSDTGGILKGGNKFNTQGNLPSRNYRNINILFFDDGDRDKFRHGYLDNKNVWIISHGWNDNPNSFKETAKRVKNEYPDDIVLLLDWSNAADNDHGTCGFNCPFGVTRAASWIGPVADKVYALMKEWGFDNKDKLRLIGHSLGSIMSGEISQRFGKAKALIALDPPSETFDGDLKGKYKVYNYPDQERKDFNQYAQFSRSFVGAMSLAGNHEFAKTANQAFVLDFNSKVDAGAEHGDVIKSFNNIISYKFYNNYLDLKDLPLNNDYYSSKEIYERRDFTGRIRIDSDGSGERSYVQQIIGAKDGKQIIYGTYNPNILNGTKRFDIISGTLDIYGAGGDDEIYNYNPVVTRDIITIKDFGDSSNDKINLMNKLPDASNNKVEIEYRYENNNGEVKLQTRYKEPGRDPSEWRDSVKIDGEKRGIFGNKSLSELSDEGYINYR